MATVHDTISAVCADIEKRLIEFYRESETLSAQGGGLNKVGYVRALGEILNQQDSPGFPMPENHAGLMQLYRQHFPQVYDRCVDQKRQ